MRPVEQRGRAILRRLEGIARPRVVEVGVLIGALSEYLLRSRRDLHLTMVDSWAPADRQPERYKATRDVHSSHAADRVALHKRQATARAARFPGRARIIAMSSADAVAQVSDSEVDLVFLDADHSYDGVREDLAIWAPKVRAGGWIGGHDYANPDPSFRFEVQRAVDEWAGHLGRALELDLNFTWFARIEAR